VPRPSRPLASELFIKSAGEPSEGPSPAEETAAQPRTEDGPAAHTPVSTEVMQEAGSTCSGADEQEESDQESAAGMVLHQEASQQRRRQHIEEALAWHRAGMTITAISCKLGVTRKTVRRWLRAGEYRNHMSSSRRPGLLDPHEEYLRQRWDAGCQNVAQLFRELRERGYTGSHSHLRHSLVQWRHHPTQTAPSV